ncbi:hypothetical protein GCM10009765_59650 [Fodinicola feengrottensis]|uniref:Glycerophosphoryl diester phosphodiesterase membrane domain-containing protein n=1 Tax=Fodinicola feengrottensis TaxID=435914 RepID=A0ABN2IC65_9ACTN
MVSANYAGWWSRAVALAKQTWQQLALLQLATVAVNLLVVLPGSLLRLWLVSGGVRGSTAIVGVGLVGNGLQLLAGVIQIAVSAIIGLAAVHLVTGAATGQPVTAVSAAQQAMPRFWPMVGWSVLFALMIAFGLVACIVPGLYLAMPFMVLAPVIAYERVNAFARSFDLVHRDFGAAIGVLATIIGVYAVALVLNFVIAGVFSAVAIAVLGSAGTYVAMVLSSIIGSVVSLVIAVFLYPLQTTAYAHLRARREPLSTGQLAAELAR